MAKQWRTNLDLARNELQNAKIQNLGADPGTPTPGQVYYNTGSNTLKVYNGTSFQDVGTTIPPATTVVAETSYGLSSAVGTSLNYARQDHTHGSTSMPTSAQVGAVANAGGVTSLQSGTTAGIPASGQVVGNVYFATDTNLSYIATSATAFAQLAPFGGAGATVTATASAAGTATTYSRSDHNHSVSTATAGSSAVGDAAAAGSGTALSLANHTHGRESFGATTAAEAFGASAAAGTASTPSRSDHVHAMPATPTAGSVGAVANNGAAPYIQSGTAVARPNTGLTVGGLYLDNDDFLAYIATSTTVYSQLAPFGATGAMTAEAIGSAAAAGSALSYARIDHLHAMPSAAAAGGSAVGDAASAGASTSISRADHTHSREAFGNVVASTSFGQASATGVATTVAHSDHVHGTPSTPTAAGVGAVANNGAAPGLQTGTAASKPGSGQTIGNIYVDNDDFLLFIATGATTFAQLAAFGGVPGNLTVSGGAAGTATTYSRSDHSHSAFTAAPSNSAVADANSSGTSTSFSRADHVHGRESFGTVTAQTTFAAASSGGAATTLSRSDHTHGTPTHDAAAHSLIPLNALATAAANYSMGSNRIISVADPVNPQDAATKNYVDNSVAGLAWKDAVAVATTAALAANTYNNGTAGVGATLTANANGLLGAIDGYTPVVGDRVLVKNEATAANNGIYVVTSVGAAGATWVLTRATDADTGPELQGATGYVQNGTLNGALAWTMTTAGTLTVGTTAMAWSIQSGANSVTAGAGLTASGNAFNVGAGTGITVAADSIAIDTTVVARKYAQAFGDGTATSYVITHSLATQDVHVTVYTNSGIFDEVICDVQHTSTNTITLLFSVAPTTNQFRVVVLG